MEIPWFDVSDKDLWLGYDVVNVGQGAEAILKVRLSDDFKRQNIIFTGTVQLWLCLWFCDYFMLRFLSMQHAVRQKKKNESPAVAEQSKTAWTCLQ